MYVDSSGMQVRPLRPIELDDAVVTRFRDILAVKLMANGVSGRWTAKLLNEPEASLRAKLERMPEHVREHYRKAALGQLLPDSTE